MEGQVDGVAFVPVIGWARIAGAYREGLAARRATQ